MYQPILKVYLSLLATLIHGRPGMLTSILFVLLSNVKPKEEEYLLWLPVKPATASLLPLSMWKIASLNSFRNSLLNHFILWFSYTFCTFNWFYLVSLAFLFVILCHSLTIVLTSVLYIIFRGPLVCLYFYIIFVLPSLNKVLTNSASASKYARHALCTLRRWKWRELVNWSFELTNQHALYHVRTNHL